MSSHHCIIAFPPTDDSDEGYATQEEETVTMPNAFNDVSRKQATQELSNECQRTKQRGVQLGNCPHASCVLLAELTNEALLDKHTSPAATHWIAQNTTKTGRIVTEQHVAEQKTKRRIQQHRRHCREHSFAAHLCV